MDMPDQRFERLCIEEYKALRAESLRCGGIISNTVWVGVTQYAVTCIAVFSLKAKFYIQLLIILLMLESIAATAMFLSEIFKYSRIGRYLRCKIEDSFIMKDSTSLAFNRPMEWEHWIQDKRTKFFYATSLFILQLPIIACFSFLGISVYIGYASAVSISGNIFLDFLFLVLFFIFLTLDIVMVVIMSLRILIENKKEK